MEVRDSCTVLLTSEQSFMGVGRSHGLPGWFPLSHVTKPLTLVSGLGFRGDSTPLLRALTLPIVCDI